MSINYVVVPRIAADKAGFAMADAGVAELRRLQSSGARGSGDPSHIVRKIYEKMVAAAPRLCPSVETVDVTDLIGRLDAACYLEPGHIPIPDDGRFETLSTRDVREAIFAILALEQGSTDASRKAFMQTGERGIVDVLRSGSANPDAVGQAADIIEAQAEARSDLGRALEAVIRGFSLTPGTTDIFGIAARALDRHARQPASVPLLNTLDMALHCEREFGFARTATREILQRLYEGKLTTYPFTTSRQIPPHYPDSVAGGLLSVLSCRSYRNRALNTDMGRRSSAWVFSEANYGNDHTPLMPTEFVTQELIDALSDDERMVFDLIVTRFLAQFEKV
jgi:hypothetical protein